MSSGAGTLLPEVDLVSLVQDQLPRYRLRADAVTEFAGYTNADWTVQAPCLSLDDDFSFSAEFIEETLKYFGNYDEIYRCYICMCVIHSLTFV